MDTGFLHTHTLVVSLYLLQLLIKVVLLLSGNGAALEKFSKTMRIPHMVLATLMLVTGGYLLYRVWSVAPTYLWIKIALVFLSIPLGVVGISKKNSMLALASLLCMGAAMGLAFAKPNIGSASSAAPAAGDDPVAKGQMIYQAQNCQTCHGPDGKLGFQGAKPLGETAMSDDEIKARIREGKGVMPPNTKITDEEMNALLSFIRSLKK